ncbi:MAG: nucleoside:proton symporter [Magnetospirillum sp. WYHS-4]
MQGVLGLAALVAVAWAMGEDRRSNSWRTVAVGLGLQIGLALLLLKLSFFREVFLWLGGAVTALQDATRAGTSFAFGYMGGGPLPFEEKVPGAGFVLAFQALPLILVMSALSALLFHWKVLPAVVKAFAWLLRRSMGVGGAVGVSAAANVFVGMVEAPLFVRPYLARLGRGEMFMVMTCGMATIAGTVMVLYASFIAPVLPGALGHLLIASIINVPAALMVSRLMVPDQGTATAADDLAPTDPAGSAMEAVTRGTMDGISLLINVTAMLIVLVALVHLANQILGLAPDVLGAPLTLQRLLGWIMAPVVWLMGVPWAEAHAAGSLMGTKTVLNEFIAYLDFAKLPPDALSEKSRLILAYALCGFANFGSLGIMIGGMGTMVPERRAEIVSLGFKAIVSGTLATCLSGTVVGLLS